MELKSHFSNIHKVILGLLKQAESDVVAAISSFSDKDIFEVLCKKAQTGVKVSVALIGDENNRGLGGLNFERLRNLGGKVIMLPPGSRDQPIIHNSFCIIDASTVITGSYNWSHELCSNEENITVITDAPEFAGNYLTTFDSLLNSVGHDGTPVVADADAARRRLEMIRNLVLLGEQEDVAAHLHKLRPIAEVLQISQIITALDQGEYRKALEEIEAHLRKATALIVAVSADIPRLCFLLETLELRLESLTDEKAELERHLITFNRRHDDALGDLIQRVLKARAELARLIAAVRKKNAQEREEAEATAFEAEETFEDYSRQHEELQRADPLPRLDEDAERELKALYRKACSLCHPDKVTENRKEAAHKVFVELQDAYKSNDLACVREIHEALAAGGLPGTRSSTLNEAEALKAAIAEMEYAIAKQVAELKALQESDGAKLMEVAGSSEAEWQRFFEQQREGLKMELSRLESAMLTESNWAS
jgi:hypothetical protein